MPPTFEQSLEALFSAFPAPESGNPEHSVSAYFMAIDGEPADAVAEAVRRFIRGEVNRDRHTFIPSTAELAIEVRACASLSRARAALAARPAKELPAPAPQISPEEREERRVMMENLIASISGNSKPATPEPPPEPERSLEMIAMDTEGLQFSSTLRVALHIPEVVHYKPPQPPNEREARR